MNPYNHPLKIVIAVHHFPPKFKGGAEWRAYRTAKWLQNQGYLVKVISVEAIDDPTTDNLRWVDEEFDSLRVRRLFLNLSKAANPARWEYDNPWIEAHLAGYLAEEKPDIFHLISGYLMTIAAIKAAKSQNIPVVATLTDFWFLCHRHTLYRTSGQICVDNTQLDCVRCLVEKKRRFRLPAQKLPTLTHLGWQTAQWLLPLSRKVAQMGDRLTALQAALSEIEVAICPSRFLMETYLKRGFRAKSMHFLRQGLTHLPPLPVKKSPSAKLRIGYIGQIAPHKGVHVLIEAYSKLQSDANGQADDASQRVQLRLYGDTTQFPDFFQYLRPQVRGDIQFMGAFDHKRLAQVYEEIDVLVVPSIWYENSPNVILEAFAHQTPVLASNLGGMAELVVDQQTGLLFAPDNAVDLTDKLKMLLNNPELLGKWQQNIIPPTHVDTEMQEVLHLYNSLLCKSDKLSFCSCEKGSPA